MKTMKKGLGLACLLLAFTACREEKKPDAVPETAETAEMTQDQTPDWIVLFDGIQDMISKSLLAVQPRVIHDKHCFELYGYDVMIDAALKPWLIEVNASPSLTADTQEDYDLKFGMLDDTFTLLDVERRRDPHDIPLQCGGFDLIWNHGPVPSFLPGAAASRIGGCNAAHEYESLSSRAIKL